MIVLIGRFAHKGDIAICTNCELVRGAHVNHLPARPKLLWIARRTWRFLPTGLVRARETACDPFKGDGH
jgi:hypothetical protein